MFMFNMLSIKIGWGAYQTISLTCNCECRVSMSVWTITTLRLMKLSVITRCAIPSSPLILILHVDCIRCAASCNSAVQSLAFSGAEPLCRRTDAFQSCQCVLVLVNGAGEGVESAPCRSS